MSAASADDREGKPSPAGENGAARLPAYNAALCAFHKAFGRELRRAIRAVPLGPRSQALDVPCGDGFYTAGLARRLFPHGRVVAADLCKAYLERARRRLARCRRVAPVEFVKADAYGLPFDDARFDLAWCAQSLISLKDPAAALAEMRRVVRPGGAVAVLEDDAYHRVLVNWPVDLELALQRAVADASRERYGSAAGLSPARRLHRLFRAAGLKPRWKRTFAADRQAPFDPAVRRFLAAHVADTRSLVAGRLTADQLAALDRLADPGAETSLLRRPDAGLTCLTTLFLATR
jgi:SAM-dependent methyltransferase